MPRDTFSVGFNYDNFDESGGRRESFQSFSEWKTSPAVLTAEQCFEAFPKIQYHMDEPQSNPSSVPALTSLHSLRMSTLPSVLSGEGADEILRRADEPGR